MRHLKDVSTIVLINFFPKKLTYSIRNAQEEKLYHHIQSSDSLVRQFADLPNVGRIYPVYSELMGIKPGRFAKRFRSLMHRLSEYIQEYLPDEFLKEFELVDVVTMFHQLHFPESFDTLHTAQKRLYFDKLLRLQLYALMKRREYQTSLLLQASCPPTPRSGGLHNPSNSDDKEKRFVTQICSPEILKRAKELRKTMTDSEQILWEILQNNQFMNTKRRRQHPFHDYILDFCNTDYKIIIEVD